MTNQVLEKVQQLVDAKDTGFKNFRAKCIGLTLAQIGLAEVMTKRMGKLTGIMMSIEDTVLSGENLKGLTPHEVVSIYSMSARALMTTADYVQKTTNTTDWVDLEAQLIVLSEDKGNKINTNVTQGAEYLLKKLNQLKLEDPKRHNVHEDIIGKALNLAASEDRVD